MYQPVVPPYLVLFAAVTRSPRPDQEVVFAILTLPVRFQPVTHLSVRLSGMGTLLRHFRRWNKYRPALRICQAFCVYFVSAALIIASMAPLSSCVYCQTATPCSPISASQLHLYWMERSSSPLTKVLPLNHQAACAASS